MKYEAPYGVSDPNSSYINGNPSTGTMGSIPPAASIENPQREIVNFITKSALTPTDADLFQLGKAVQTGLVNYGLDVGVPNQIAITPVVPVGAYAVGMRFVIKVAHSNTSSVTVNVSGLGNVPLVHCDLSPLVAYELLVGQLIEVAYDGTSFQMISGGGPNALVVMTAPRDVYVNPSTGSDTLYDGTAAVVSGSSGPYQTIQKALAQMKKYNLGGWTFTIHLADGVYANTNPIQLPQPNGSGVVAITGNLSAPANVSIFNTGTGSVIEGWNGGNWQIQGCSFRATAAKPGDLGNGLWFLYGTSLQLGPCDFNSVPGNHITIGANASCLVYGNLSISGSASTFFNAYTNGVLMNTTPTNPNVTINAAVNLPNGFVSASDGGLTWPLWGTITGAGNVTGPKYNATSNGVVNVQGRGTSYLPGSTAGTLSSGGQYL